MPDQDEIAAYEGLLRSIPQIQVVSNDHVSSSWSSLVFDVCLTVYFLFLKIKNPLCSDICHLVKMPVTH